MLLLVYFTKAFNFDMIYVERSFTENISTVECHMTSFVIIYEPLLCFALLQENEMRNFFTLRD